MYSCEITFKDYVNYKVNLNCLGLPIITMNSIKINEYHQKCIKEMAEKYDVNIELIKLIDSKIIIPKNILYDSIFNNQNTEIKIRFENAELKNNKLIELCNSNLYSIKKLNSNINQIIEFCNKIVNKYTIEQLTNKKSNGLLSSKVEKIVYESYNELDDIRLIEFNFLTFKLPEQNIHNYITKQINKEALYCFNFVLYVYSLSSEEYKKIKENVELKLKKEEEIFNKKMDSIIQEKVKDVSLNYDKIIKKLIANNETHVCDLNSIIEELKKNGELASIELLTILEEKEKLKIENKSLIEKNKQLEYNNKELDEKHKQMWEEDYAFFNKLIRKTSISKLDLNGE